MNRNYNGNILPVESLEKVNGGQYWCPPWENNETDGIPYSVTDGINENGVYIGVNVYPTGCVGS